MYMTFTKRCAVTRTAVLRSQAPYSSTRYTAIKGGCLLGYVPYANSYAVGSVDRKGRFPIRQFLRSRIGGSKTAISDSTPNRA